MGACRRLQSLGGFICCRLEVPMEQRLALGRHRRNSVKKLTITILSKTSSEPHDWIACVAI